MSLHPILRIPARRTEWKWLISPSGLAWVDHLDTFHVDEWPRNTCGKGFLSMIGSNIVLLVRQGSTEKVPSHQVKVGVPHGWVFRSAMNYVITRMSPE
jgi:hypothetical protein